MGEKANGFPLDPYKVGASDGEKMPPFDVTKTPEFSAAVAAAVAEAVRQIAPPPAAPVDAMKGLATEIALAIEALSRQNNPAAAPIFDPRVLEKQRAAHARMEELIKEALAIPEGDPRRPVYGALGKLNLEHVMIEPFRRDPATRQAVQQKFVWCLAPNDLMEPKNEMAVRIYSEFRASVGKEHLKHTKRPGVPWMTHAGLYLEGTPQKRTEIQEARVNSPALELGADPFDPNANYVRVLGTIHEPARQNTHEQPL